MPRRLFFLPLFSLLLCAATPDLMIQVIRGAGANNNVISGDLVSPVVRVINAAGTPVPGVLVVFTAPTAGPSVEFTGSGTSAQALSDESGTVAAPRVKPVGADGQVEIRVTAAKDGKSANVSIFQMNLGLESGTEPPDALEISMIPVVENSPPAAKSTGRRRLRFRVETASGTPVAGALVRLTVETVKFEETSASDGTVLMIVERNVGRVPLEIAVKAAVGGRSGTRYFVIEN